MNKLNFTIVLLALFPAIALSQDSRVASLQQLLTSYGLKADQATLQRLVSSSSGQSNDKVSFLLVAPQQYQQHQQLVTYQQQQQPAQSNQLLVQAPVQPVSVHYRSQSVPLEIQHTHIPAPKPETRLSRSEEEPHRIIHEVIRPVIQEVREIIQPYRRIIQEVRPVQESIVSRVATNQKQTAYARPSNSEN